jgi:hypothetical protein
MLTRWAFSPRSHRPAGPIAVVSGCDERCTLVGAPVGYRACVEQGWYSDPNGGPGLRWWDGSAWTEHTSPQPDATAVEAAPAVDPTLMAPDPGGPPGFDPAFAGPPPGGLPLSGDVPSPGVPAMSGEFPPPGAPAMSGGFPPPGAPPGGGGNRVPLIVAGVVVAALLGGAGFVLLSGDDGEAATGTTSTTRERGTIVTEEDATTSLPSDEADSETVSSGSLTYTRLPEPWQDWASNGQQGIPELAGTAGQFVVVQEEAPTGGQWIGNLLIGELGNDSTYGGEADLPRVTSELSQDLIANYYVDDAQSSVVQETAVTIDGHPGYFMHHELTFQQEGLETTREKVVIVVVDTGQERPGVFWASIPYNRADLNTGMDEVYRSLRVDD